MKKKNSHPDTLDRNHRNHKATLKIEAKALRISLRLCV